MKKIILFLLSINICASLMGCSMASNTSNDELSTLSTKQEEKVYKKQACLEIQMDP